MVKEQECLRFLFSGVLNNVRYRTRFKSVDREWEETQGLLKDHSPRLLCLKQFAIYLQGCSRDFSDDVRALRLDSMVLRMRGKHLSQIESARTGQEKRLALSARFLMKLATCNSRKKLRLPTRVEY